VPEPSAFEFEINVVKLQRHKSTGTDQINVVKLQRHKSTGTDQINVVKLQRHKSTGTDQINVVKLQRHKSTGTDQINAVKLQRHKSTGTDQINVVKVQRHKSTGTDQIPTEFIKAGRRNIHNEINKLTNSIWNNVNWLWRGRSWSLYLSIRRAIKQIIVITGAHHFCHLCTKFYPTSCRQG